MRAKKSLGQHFLKSQSAIEKIIEAGAVSKDDPVLEIGPGKGVLTKALLERAEKVIAVEKDGDLVEYLHSTFSDEIAQRQLQVIHGDILTADFSKLGLTQKKFKVIANIPYYITGILVRTLLESNVQPSAMVLLIQKEVAERIAKDKKESVLSLSVKAYGTPRYVGTVKAASFRPQPKVDSAILAVTGISKDFFDTLSEKYFFTVLKAGFKSKRKRLLNNLEAFGTKECLCALFDRLSIDYNSRPEDVPLQMWKRLALALQEGVPERP